MQSEIIKTIESKIKDLPTLPSVVLRIVEIANNPESNIEDLKSVITTDQVVSARIMKLVNSAYFGFPRQIDSLSKAIIILGFNNIRAIALSVSIMEMFKTNSADRRFDYREIWKHSVGVAFAARAIALHTMPRFTDQCFAAGLLHDIGVIVIDRCFPANYARVAELVHERNMTIFEAEGEVLGYTHCEVGEYLAQKWQLPDLLTEAISRHHDPSAATENPRVTLAVHAANIIVKVRGFGDIGDNKAFTLDSLHPEAKRLFKVQNDFPTNILESIEIEMQEAERLLGHVV